MALYRVGGEWASGEFEVFEHEDDHWTYLMSDISASAWHREEETDSYDLLECCDRMADIKDMDEM